MKQSAGILVFRRKGGAVEVFLAHPGGPFWAKKDKRAWSIPKGEFSEEEEPLAAAKREFAEEIGQAVPGGELIELGHVKTKAGKVIHAWAVEGEVDAAAVKSNSFSMEWPPKSGQQQEFPEIDKASWFDISAAGPKLHSGQALFLERLAERLGLKYQKPEQSSLF